MVPPKKLTLDTINEHLTCRLCSGYLIDAWTINECLHSFCRPCIFSYFAEPDENTACPVCATVPHPGNPLLGITKDCWLQQIVYKLVPSLFKREMCQRRIYYDSNPESKQQLLEQYTKTHGSKMGCREEELGELSERCLFQQKDKLNDKESIYVTLEYHQTHELCFLECSSNMPINILKQYLKKVLPLSKRARYQIDVLHEQKVLLDNLTLNHIHAWKANSQAEKRKQLHLFYRVIVIEREEAEPEETDTTILQPVTNTIEPKPPAFIRSASVYDQQNPSTFVHTTPFIPAEAKTISLNNTITEQLQGNETIELIKAKECTLLDCKTMTITTPFSYSMSPLGDMSKPKKRTKKSNGNDSAPKKCKVEKKSKKKIKEEQSLTPIVACNPSVTPSENENPHEIVEQKQLSYSEVIQEANKLLAADEPMTPVNPPSIAPAPVTPLTNPTTARLTKPIATVSPLHTSKNNHNRVIEQVDEDQLIDLSKPTLAPTDVPLKSVTKKRSRQGSSSTTRTKVSRSSNKSSNDEGNDLSKSLKKTHSSQLLHPPPLPPPPSTPSATPAQQQMFQNLFHSFQNQANYWPMTPWPVPPSLALMADPRNYYAQAWAAPPHHAPPPPPQPSTLHGPKDLSSASLNDFIHEPSNSVFSLPPSTALLNPGSNFSRTSSSSSLHLHHASSRHRPTPLNGTLS